MRLRSGHQRQQRHQLRVDRQAASSPCRRPRGACRPETSPAWTDAISSSARGVQARPILATRMSLGSRAKAGSQHDDCRRRRSPAATATSRVVARPARRRVANRPGVGRPQVDEPRPARTRGPRCSSASRSTRSRRADRRDQQERHDERARRPCPAVFTARSRPVSLATFASRWAARPDAIGSARPITSVAGRTATRIVSVSGAFDQPAADHGQADDRDAPRRRSG